VVKSAPLPKDDLHQVDVGCEEVDMVSIFQGPILAPSARRWVALEEVNRDRGLVVEDPHTFDTQIRARDAAKSKE